MRYTVISPRYLTSSTEINFVLRVDDPSVNKGQMASDFDAAFENALPVGGAAPFELRLPPDIPQKLDFAFAFGGRSVAVEIA